MNGTPNPDLIQMDSPTRPALMDGVTNGDFQKFSCLPIELQRYVVDQLSFEDLKSMRTAAKTLSDHVAKRLFETIIVDIFFMKTGPLELLHSHREGILVREHLRKHVKRIIFANVEMIRFTEHYLNVLPRPLTIEIRNWVFTETDWTTQTRNCCIFESLLGLKDVETEAVEIAGYGSCDDLFGASVEEFEDFHPIREMEACGSVLNRITALRLGFTDFYPYDSGTHPSERVADISEKLSILLGSCPDLTKLTLKMHYMCELVCHRHPDVSLEDILSPGRVWKKLTSLKLQGFVAKQSALETLLRSHKDSLTSVSLSDFHRLEPSDDEGKSPEEAQNPWLSIKKLICTEMKVTHCFLQGNKALDSAKLIIPITEQRASCDDDSIFIKESNAL